MSSTAGVHRPEEVYDDDIDTYIHSLPLANTLHWWSAHFNTRIHINRIRFVARKDFPSRLGTYNIFSILNDQNTRSSLSKVFFANTGSISLINKEKTLTCDQIADGIIVESPPNKNGKLLNFAEIYIYGEEEKLD